MYSNAYTRYVTSLLLITYIFNQVDRGVFGILMEPIKNEFRLSDTQLGFLAGPALVVLYATLGVPVARWGDRSHRINIMSFAIALWSAIAMSTAAAGKFWHLALARIGVGVGEAGFSAIAMSVIGDYHGSAAERARALSHFMLAIPIAGMVASLMGGWINELYGWRTVFVVAGLPGIALALLMKWTVREPPRRQTASDLADKGERPSLGAVFATIWRRRTLRNLILAQGVANVAAVGMGWTTVFFIRNHHMSTGEVGTWAAITGLGAAAGIWLSGHLVGRWGVRDERIRVRLMTYSSLLVAPLAMVILWSPSKYVALVTSVLFNIPAVFFLVPTSALAQELSAASMRATMLAVFIMVQLLAGGVIGIQLVGVLSDTFTPLLGDNGNALRWSMTLTSLLSWVAAAYFWRASHHIRDDLRDVAGDSPTPPAVDVNAPLVVSPSPNRVS